MTRRLAALERQVEEALAVAGQSALALPPFDAVLDRVLDVYGRLRRVLAGEPGAAADLVETPLDLLYRWWWRVDVIGLERLPGRGPVLVVANRAGMLVPMEAFMLARALGRQAGGDRAARPFVDEWQLRIPIIGTALSALGALPANTAVRRVLAAGEVAITFPEGPAAIAKGGAGHYRLAPFGRGALRVALEAGVPIVPVAVIGAEEVQPAFWRLERLGRLLGLPAVPVTPALVPLPTKWTIHVGEPVDGTPHGADQRAMRALRARVRERLQGLMSDGVRRRRGLFS